MDYGPSGLFTIQLGPCIFLAQNWTLALRLFRLNFKILYHPHTHPRYTSSYSCSCHMPVSESKISMYIYIVAVVLIVIVHHGISSFSERSNMDFHNICSRSSMMIGHTIGWRR
jgi:hypothetical protein